MSVEAETTADPATDDADEEELLARIETLQDENERLHRELSAARRTRYRRTAIGMAFLGGLGLLGAGLIPSLREPLLALGGTGLFGALLTYYLTPSGSSPPASSRRSTARWPRTSSPSPGSSNSPTRGCTSPSTATRASGSTSRNSRRRGATFRRRTTSGIASS
jgi:hypothetical protein